MQSVETPNPTFVVYAVFSAVAAAATAILAKIGIEGVPSTLATALRTVVVLVMAWGIVIANGEYRDLARVSSRSFLFLGLSGIATGLSWLAYFRALSLGPASRVAPIDKLSVAITVILAFIILREPFTWKIAAGVLLIVAGTLLTMR